MGKEPSPSTAGSKIRAATVEISVEGLPKKTGIDYRTLACLHRLLLCDFSWEDMIECLVTSDKHQ